jgi:hypothetical protein
LTVLLVRAGFTEGVTADPRDADGKLMETVTAG